MQIFFNFELRILNYVKNYETNKLPNYLLSFLRMEKPSWIRKSIDTITNQSIISYAVHQFFKRWYAFKYSPMRSLIYSIFSIFISSDCTAL